MSSSISIGTAFRDLGRFLTFRATSEEYDRFGLPHFLIGFLFTWLVGIARNWDFPAAPLAARAGLMSLAYIFFMGMVIFLFAWPISGTRRNYWQVLTVVAMTAPPGLVYGIPVEMFLPLDVAQGVNLWFLAIVATWRVALAFHFLIRGADNGFGQAFAILLTPIALLVLGLVTTGRAGYVMDIMGGLRKKAPTAQDQVDEVIALAYCLAWPLLVVGAIVYLGALVRGRSET